MNNKWIGQKYDAKSVNLSLETLENVVLKCKFCGSRENLGIVYKEITQVIGPYKMVGYYYNYFSCEKCDGR